MLYHIFDDAIFENDTISDQRFFSVRLEYLDIDWKKSSLFILCRSFIFILLKADNNKILSFSGNSVKGK